MKQETKRLTVDIPEELHEAFMRKCFLAKPRVSMKDRVISFIAEETGRPIPKNIDRRKLTREQRDRIDKERK